MNVKVLLRETISDRSSNELGRDSVEVVGVYASDQALQKGQDAELHERLEQLGFDGNWKSEGVGFREGDQVISRDQEDQEDPDLLTIVAVNPNGSVDVEGPGPMGQGRVIVNDVSPGDLAYAEEESIDTKPVSDVWHYWTAEAVIS